tara:strand:+ start:251 stop:676 length:426 start_codon:yes stop_codon:yes gene_type:complete
MNFICSDLSSLKRIAIKIIDFSKECRVIIFKGEIGSGKTTLIKHILNHLNVKDLVTSPTYSIINQYETFDNDIIYHFDFFRIENEFEALEIGFNEFINSKNYCLIEWPEKIKNLLPSKFIKVNINYFEYDKRKIRITKNNF